MSCLQLLGGAPTRRVPPLVQAPAQRCLQVTRSVRIAIMPSTTERLSMVRTNAADDVVALVALGVVVRTDRIMANDARVWELWGCGG